MHTGGPGVDRHSRQTRILKPAGTIAALLFVLALAACGGSDEAEVAPAAASTAAETTAGESAAAEPDPTATPFFRSSVFQQLEKPTPEAGFIPEGATITGDQAMDVVRGYLSEHRMSLCRTFSRTKGWHNEFQGDSIWLVAFSPQTYDYRGPFPFDKALREGVGIQDARIWSYNESTQAIEMIEGLPKC